MTSQTSPTSPTPRAPLNLGILAHVDAGKTTLTERLLFDAGVIDELGSVDDGTTQTDSLALERRRGITIRSAVATFTIGEVVVNLIDTPGHSDFVAEVERVLGVLDGAVLVVSAVEGVQSQTRVLLRALGRLGVPTMMFVNKIDRAGAEVDEVVAAMARVLSPKVTPMGFVDQPGSKAASFTSYETSKAALAELAGQTRAGNAYPVFLGSAITGAGVAALRAGIAELLPPAAPEPDTAGVPLSASVFKVDRGPDDDKIAYVRMWAGRLRVRDRLQLHGEPQKVTAIRTFVPGGTARTDSVGAGRIAQVWGLAGVRIGDVLGEPPAAAVGSGQFAPPTLETVVEALPGSDPIAMHTALTRLAEQDPLIGLRQDDERRELSIRLYGEVQKEVIAATLADSCGVEVAFAETTTICVEQIAGTGAAVEFIGAESNPHLATVGLRIGPAPPGHGVEFGLAVELGSMPPAFFTAVEQSARASLRTGGLYGWEVPDCVVTMTHCGYWPRQSRMHGTFDASMSSTAGDFRALTRVIVARALRQAGTVVAEPIDRFELEAPRDLLAANMRALAELRGVVLDTDVGDAVVVVTGELPAASVHRLRSRLPELTRGEGLLVTRFERHQPLVLGRRGGLEAWAVADERARPSKQATREEES